MKETSVHIEKRGLYTQREQAYAGDTVELQCDHRYTGNYGVRWINLFKKTDINNL